GDVMRAVDRQGHQCDDAGDNCVPIQDSGFGAGAPVGPQRKEKVALLIQRNAANHVAQSSAVKNGEQNTGESEAAVKETTPDGSFQMHAQFNADTAQNEEPQNDHE